MLERCATTTGACRRQNWRRGRTARSRYRRAFAHDWHGGRYATTSFQHSYCFADFLFFFSRHSARCFDGEVSVIAWLISALSVVKWLLKSPHPSMACLGWYPGKQAASGAKMFPIVKDPLRPTCPIPALPLSRYLGLCCTPRSRLFLFLCVLTTLSLCVPDALDDRETAWPRSRPSCAPM